MSSSSNAFIQLVRAEIEKQHSISFARFMELALYHPEFGYYNTKSFTVGKKGDFTTAPEISPLFARCLARQFIQINHALDAPNILELGAGTGRFALDVLLELQALQQLPRHYFIYEISAGLRQKQQLFLQQACPNLFSRIIWLDSLPENFVGIIFANEVLDALPVHCFRIEDNQLFERCVTWKSHQFTWTLSPPSKALLAQASTLQQTYHLPNGYESEINLGLSVFMQSLTQALARGVILLMDYGYGQREYYHPERCHGTLAGFYHHTRSDDPFAHPGMQDITAHVDFTRVAETAVENHCLLLGYTSQAAFLLACGLMTLAAEEEKKCSPADEVNLHHAIKLLTLPTEMGERVKIMALGKGIDSRLIGFTLQDRRRDL